MGMALLILIVLPTMAIVLGWGVYTLVQNGFELGARAQQKRMEKASEVTEVRWELDQQVKRGKQVYQIVPMAQLRGGGKRVSPQSELDILGYALPVPPEPVVLTPPVDPGELGDTIASLQSEVEEMNRQLLETRTIQRALTSGS